MPLRTSARTQLRGLPAVLAALLALALVLVHATSAGAMPREAPDETWGTNGRVNAIVQVGNIVYIGGNFTEVHEDGGAGAGVRARSYLAAFDATTGQPTSWAPSADGEVFALAASPDGSRIYAGGAFTRVNGSWRGRLAGITAGGTGVLDTAWRPPSANGKVMALALGTDRLYVGGLFTAVGGQPRSKLAALSTSTGALDAAWVPSANGGVTALAASPAGTVYAGGLFSVVSGQSRRNAVALGAAAGEVVSSWRPDPGQKVFSLAIQDTTVYAGIGGYVNAAAAWDAVTALERWRRRMDGDVQAVAVSGNIVYVGGHYNYVESELHRKLVALDTATGALRRDWLPKLPATSATWYGIASLSTYGQSRLVAGGDFDSVSGFRQERYAQWTGSIGGSPIDTTPPSTPELKATAGPPITVPPDRTPPALRISRRVVRASARRIVTVRVRCPRSERVCTGTLTLRRARGKRAATPGGRGSRARVLGRAPFRVSGGRSRDVRVRLSARGRRVLRRVRRLRVTATAVVRDDAGNTATVAQRFTMKWRRTTRA
jgi:hypothetical protein